ncbi:MAG: PAS domain-containing protein [Rhodospirillaceae bacterium]|nr:PAS domain-containing protein [Rhodospirillaceae bacterium]
MRRARGRFLLALAVWIAVVTVFFVTNPFVLPFAALVAVTALAAGVGASTVAERTLIRGLAASMKAGRESAERLQDFSDAASDWLWEMNSELRFIYASDRFYELSGLTPEDFLDRRQDLLAEAEPDSPEWRSHLINLKRQRPFRDFTYMEKGADGVEHWFRLSGMPKFDDEGHFTGYRGTGTDITAEVRAREEAVESTLRFLDAMEHVTDGIAFWNAEDRFVLCNQRYREQAGPAAVRLVRGTSYADFLRAVFDLMDDPPAPDVREKWIARRVAEHRASGDPIEVNRSGRWLLIRDDATPDGSIVSVVTDITEMKQRAQELQRVVDTVPLLIAYVGQDGRYQLINRTFEDWLQLSQAEVRGKRVGEMMQDHVVVGHVQEVEAVLAGKPARFEARIPYKGGASLPGYRGARVLEVTFTPNVDAHDTVTGFFIAASDITERGLAAAQLHQAQKMEAIGQLTGGVAHDFNNLLAIMVGSLSLLEGRTSGEREQKLVGSALRAAKRGGELTQRLLAFGRRQALVSEIVDANALIEDLTDLLRRTLGVDIAVETRFGNHLWRMNVDPGQLENALINLAINARDAMGGAGTLWVETDNIILDRLYTRQFEDLKPGSYVMIAVSDTGSGMTAEVLERAVEPFFSTKETGQGSGLGLSMIYGFTKQSGGQMRIYSEVGEGTTVRLYLPAVEPDTRETPKPLKGERPAASASGERILVIEDDANVRAVTVELLEQLGYGIVQATTGHEAVEIGLSEEPFDMIFSDVFLPGGMSGPEAVREIKKHRPSVPVLFTSGYSADHFADKNLIDGDTQMIAKPFELGALAARLRECLGEGAQD